MSDDLLITLDGEEADLIADSSDLIENAESFSAEVEELDDKGEHLEIQKKEEVVESQNKNEPEEEKIKAEHYANNKPEEFCSENFKIEISGLPKYYALGQLKKLLNNTLQLDVHKVKPGGMGRSVAYVNLKSEESRTKSKLVINGYKWQDHSLTAVDADPAKDPVLLSKIDFLKVAKKEHEALPLLDRITKAVTPYHDMPYEDQIKEKEKVVKQVMKKFGNELAQINPEIKEFIQWQKSRRNGQICEMDEFVHSPVKEGYRNKCEFTIGKNKETDDPVVGFRVASYKEGSVEVGPVAHLKHLNNKMKEVVKSLEQFLKNSEHKPFDPFSHEGVWRQLTVRTSNNDDVMIILVIHPQKFNEEEIQSIKDSVVTYFCDGDGKEVGVTSIFFQQYGQKESGKEVEYEHLWGKEYIEETILGKTFRASPDAFLQVNTAACEVLYSKISEILDIDSTTVLLDLCCGVGTIGLSVAENAYKVFGVEIVGTAVDSAKTNCSINGVTNAVFYHGRAEDYIDNMIERSERVNTVAIVDPPRAGLNGSVMNALRKCEYMDTLVYISCDPQAALANFQALGRPRSKTYKGSYFVPIRATPIDLFPDTPHFELVIVFERYDECKWDRIIAGNPRPKDQAYFDRVPELTYDPEQVKKEREEKRQQEREEREAKRKNSRNRDSRNSHWARNEDGERTWNRGGGNRSGEWRGGDGSRAKRDWDDNGGRRAVRDEYSVRPPIREQFGTGFSEGFQAGLEALGAAAVAAITAPALGFSQGGGWNMANTQGFSQGNNYNMDTGIDNRVGGQTWGYHGNNRGNSSSNTVGNMRGYDQDLDEDEGNRYSYRAGSNNLNNEGNSTQLGIPYYERQNPSKKRRGNDHRYSDY